MRRRHLRGVVLDDGETICLALYDSDGEIGQVDLTPARASELGGELFAAALVHLALGGLKNGR